MEGGERLAFEKDQRFLSMGSENFAVAYVYTSSTNWKGKSEKSRREVCVCVCAFVLFFRVDT